ncbi:chemosensory protein [Asbolus verrucosus]|uniref:Chemosensory protein n=1 Tax=Asbolus verrucosus TaxID=1661398 RepID=A0A482WBE1_ASBVE|nr:chemosensory protein [Asbolus verrucosus]
MKVSILLLICANLVLCDQYTTKYDNMDIDEILSSERLLKNYFNCIMDRGPCVPEGAELKRVLPDALQTGCEKCSDKQKQACKRIVRFLMDDKPQMWKELTAKYDPEGIYFEKYKDQLDC